MKRALIAAALGSLMLTGCTDPAPTPSPSETASSPTPTVTVTSTPNESPTAQPTTPAPAATLTDWPWDIAQLEAIAVGDTFKAIAASTGEALTPCPTSDDAFVAVGDDWALAMRGQGKDILDEGGYIAQTATSLALVPLGALSGPVGPTGPLGLQLGSSQADVASAWPDATVTEAAGATLYSAELPDGAALTIEVTDGLVSRIAVSEEPVAAGDYSPIC